MRRLAVLLAVVALGTTLTGCRDDTVRLTFRPRVGASYLYETRVRTVTEVELEGSEPDVTRDDTILQARHTVLDAGAGGVRVRVVLQASGEEPRAYVVRFDRAAQLQGIERIEGIPPAALGELGIAEIFPAATGAPPPRRLSPGARWRIADEVTLPGIEGSPRLVGRGVLEEVGIVDGHDVARVRTSSRLPLRAVSDTPNGELRFEGMETTRYRATHDLDDGAVRSSSSFTVGTFRIVLSPPLGRTGDPLPGTLHVEIRSETRLVE